MLHWSGRVKACRPGQPASRFPAPRYIFAQGRAEIFHEMERVTKAGGFRLGGLDRDPGDLGGGGYQLDQGKCQFPKTGHDV